MLGGDQMITGRRTRPPVVAPSWVNLLILMQSRRSQRVSKYHPAWRKAGTELQSEMLLQRIELDRTYYEDNDLVFPGPLGQPLDPNVLIRNWAKLAQ